MDGVLNIDKPAGITSHDVVLRVRRLLREKRIGHTGTLDPLATGVLVLCLGKATRIARYLEAGEKEYEAVMRLGIVTDTLDAEGSILECRTYQAPTVEMVHTVLARFIGTIAQTPPAFSAIKVGGVASYTLARQGKAAPLKSRNVSIHTLDLLEYADPFISIRVRCSKGVYIRTLCSDIGEALGGGAHVTSLRRTRSGSFRIADSVTLEKLATAMTESMGEHLFLSIDEALHEVPLVTVNEPDSVKIVHGVRISNREGVFGIDQDLVRIHDHQGSLLALGSTLHGELRPVAVFAQDRMAPENTGIHQ